LSRRPPSHDKHDAQQGIAFERFGKLANQRCALLPALGRKRKEFLELIQESDPQHRFVCRVLSMRALGEEAGDVDLHQVPGVDARAGPARQDVERINVVDLARLDCIRYPAAHAGRRQDLVTARFEQRDQACIEQRRLACAGIRVEENDRMGDDEGAQITRLAVAPEEEVLFVAPERTWSDVGLLVSRCH